MRCIHCQTDSKYSERKSGACPKCQHLFAFEPKSGDKFTDPAFLAAIERVSSGGTVRFTARHLYYEIVRRSKRKHRARPWIYGLLVLIATLLGVLASGFFFIPAGVFLIAIVVTLPSKLAGLSYDAFGSLLETWTKVHGAPKGLIVRKDAPAKRALPPDIQHYSFDRAVISDTPDTVDLLLANNFHFENNCAVLSADGYPATAFDVVRGMLQNNPKLSVYVLHDATPEGCGLAQRLATSGWFQPSARIVDVGLTPQHARAFKGCWQPAQLAATQAGQSPWLAHYSLELAVIRPEQVIKRLFRALSNTAELASDAGGIIFFDSGAFSSDASASDGGGDSFG